MLILISVTCVISIYTFYLLLCLRKIGTELRINNLNRKCKIKDFEWLNVHPSNCDVSFIVEADRDTVWKTLNSFDRYVDWIDDMKDVKLTEKSENDGRQILKGDFLCCYNWLFEGTLSIIHTIVQEDYCIHWELDRERNRNLFVIENTGCWQLTEIEPGKCQVQYKVRLVLRVPLPAFVRDTVMRSVCFSATHWLHCATREVALNGPRANAHNLSATRSTSLPRWLRACACFDVMPCRCRSS